VYLTTARKMLAYLAVPKLNRIRKFKGAIVGGSVKRTCVKARGRVAYMCDQVELLWELEGFQQAVESVVETLFCIHGRQKVRRATTEFAFPGVHHRRNNLYQNQLIGICMVEMPDQNEKIWPSLYENLAGASVTVTPRSSLECLCARLCGCKADEPRNS
jgi:hypothetical protein